jgi:hypothetical protein
MAHNRKTRVLIPTQNARLEELLMLFGCGDEIAPFDADPRWPTRAGKLIAKGSLHQPTSSRWSGGDASA